MESASLLSATRLRSFEGITLRTERLKLRAFESSDAEAILALFSDHGFMEYAPVPPFESLAEAHALVARDAVKRAAGERLRLGIERVEDGKLIGHCDIFNIDRDCRKGEIGYGLLTTERGFGFMKEALSAFLHWVFNDLSLNRVMAEIDPTNTNSERTLQRLGFTKEGHFREHCICRGVVSDSVFYALLQRDFQSLQTVCNQASVSIMAGCQAGCVPSFSETSLSTFGLQPIGCPRQLRQCLPVITGVHTAASKKPLHYLPNQKVSQSSSPPAGAGLG